MSEAENYSIQGITRKSIFLILLLGLAAIGVWKALGTPSDWHNMVSITLIASLIAPLSIMILIHFYTRNSPDRLFEDVSKIILYLIPIAAIDCATTVWIGHTQTMSFSENPTSYFLSFLLIIFNCAVFIFNIQSIRDQLENMKQKSDEWMDAFMLMTSTFWIFIPVYFFVGRLRRD